MTVEITSLHNPRIKELVKLRKRRVRDTRRLTLVEGVRECLLALAHGGVPVEAYVCPPLRARATDQADSRALDEQLANLAAAGPTRVYNVTPQVFAKAAYRDESDGVLLVLPYGDTELDALPMVESPCYVVIEGVEKPGNLGAILRTADAAGVHGAIVAHASDRPATDLYNPNVIRASLGALFSVPTAEASSAETIAWLRAQAISIIAATPDAATQYTELALAGAVAIVLGSEANGLSGLWQDAADAAARIPMHGVVNSLNLATSAALLLYEAERQRNA